MSYRSTMFGFLMRHTSTWMVWLINKMCDFERQRIHVWFMRSFIMHRKLQCESPSQVMDCWGQLSLRRKWTLSAIYCKHVARTFVPHLATGLPLQTQWFMHDGARPHTANVVLDFMHYTFDSRVISFWFPDRYTCEQNWPPNSPDLNSCDYFFGGIP
jgi:hypothetical protein